MEVLFKENQRFTSWYFILIVLFLIGVMWYGFIQQIYFGKPFGTNPASDTTLWVLWVLFGIAFPIFFLTITLTTEINESGIFVRFRPFHLKKRKFMFSEMKSINVETYNPLREFFGFGLRFSLNGTTAYNVKGSKGIRIEMMDGRKYLIGTQKAEEVEKLIRSIGI
ncbi:DUF6141 family protein [Pseudalkalibacillus sp. R45]|uniref:DUF6141 family protein n=1 Tax=Pseudalkalibacillus sp. R45 TaxID=3457433 RepID=UPI003FCDBB77